MNREGKVSFDHDDDDEDDTCNLLDNLDHRYKEKTWSGAKSTLGI